MANKSKSIIGRLIDTLSKRLNITKYSGIDELREQARRLQLIDRNDPEIVEAALFVFESTVIRRSVNKKDDTGFPLFPSLRVTDARGKSTRMYIRERKMNRKHYDQFQDSCRQQVHYWQRMENATVDRINHRFHEQLELPWPEITGDPA